MKKMTAIALFSSALLLSACDQAQDAADSALDSGADLMEQAGKEFGANTLKNHHLA